MVKVAILGFGGISQSVHLPAYLQLEKEGKVQLVAVCDVDPSRFEKAMEINIGGSDATLGESVHKYTDWKEMVENETFDMVDICLPTYLHAPLSIEMLNHGYHVLCEKPMSLTYEKSMEMCEAAKAAGRKLMIGQCIRFAGTSAYIKDAIDNNTFGKLISGVFRRMSGPPVWGWDNWFMDYERSHGCVLDMHIHDIDLIRHFLGEPKAVSCNTWDFYSGRDIAHTQLYYPGCTIMAIGDWSQEGINFKADMRLAFEKATIDVGGEDGLKVYPRGGEAFVPEISDKDFYLSEIEFFVEMLENGTENTVNAPESAALSVRLINAMCESADKGGEKIPYTV